MSSQGTKQASSDSRALSNVAIRVHPIALFADPIVRKIALVFPEYR
jgi:hypothetical protein